MIRKVFSSRKFTTAVFGALLIGLNDALGLGLKEETIRDIVLILAGWLIGESVIDASAAFGQNGKNGKNGGATHPASAPAAQPSQEKP